jgi:thiol-disulfide isomerase/thioredoxin
LYTTYRQYSASQLKKVYEALDPAIAGTTYGKAFLDNIHKMTDNSTGDIAAEISATDYIDNKPFSLKAQKGKYVIVDFWGSWCKPCIQLIPSLVTEYNKYKDKNIEFISVCRDYNGNMSKCKEIATTLGMTWTNLWDSEDKTDKSNITSVYNVGIYPTTILVGPNGEILERGDGDLGFLKCKNRLEKIFKTAL